VRGMIVEMPVLDQALIACLVAFGPLMIALAVGRPVAKLMAVDSDPASVPLARDRSPAAVRHGTGAGKTRRTCGRVH